MDGRQFLDVARLSLDDGREEWVRTAAGRAYYGIFIETPDALARWGFAAFPRFQLHAFVRNCLITTKIPDLMDIAEVLRELFSIRSSADYDTTGSFTSAFLIEKAIESAEDAIVLLDAIDTDPSRRAAAIVAIRALR